MTVTAPVLASQSSTSDIDERPGGYSDEEEWARENGYENLDREDIERLSQHFNIGLG
jgi:hypothetical protein